MTALRMDRHQGFTLLEMLITIVVLGIVLGTAVPYFGQIIQKNRIDVVAYSILDTLQLARTEAVKRKKTILLCPAKDDTLQECSSKNDWNHGWILMVDAEILKVWQGNPQIDVISTNQQLTFLSSGLINAEHLPAQFTIQATECAVPYTKVINVNRLGAPNMKSGGC